MIHRAGKRLRFFDVKLRYLTSIDSLDFRLIGGFNSRAFTSDGHDGNPQLQSPKVESLNVSDDLAAVFSNNA